MTITGSLYGPLADSNSVLGGVPTNGSTPIQMTSVPLTLTTTTAVLLAVTVPVEPSSSGAGLLSEYAYLAEKALAAPRGSLRWISIKNLASFGS
jgi:hypothetical protein